MNYVCLLQLEGLSGLSLSINFDLYTRKAIFPLKTVAYFNFAIISTSSREGRGKTESKDI